MPDTSSAEQPSALVTGANEGLGRTIADTLASAGYRVFGTSRTERPNRPGVDMLRLDLSDEASVSEFAETVKSSISRIDLLVNNAGMTVVAPSEELPLHIARHMMEVNFFGPTRLVNAVLPLMRARRSGHLIFISSLAGLMGVPGQSFYCATKHALEGYADGLYAEMKLFGINVTLLEPGSFKTQIIENSPKPDWPTQTVYDGVREHLREVVTDATAAGADPRLIADVVLKVATRSRPRLRYRVDADGKRAIFFKSFLPEEVFYGVVAKRFGL